MKILGLETANIPDDVTPMGFALLVEGMDADGEHVIYVRWVGMDHLRRVGAITVLQQRITIDAADGFEDDDS